MTRVVAAERGCSVGRVSLFEGEGNAALLLEVQGMLDHDDWSFLRGAKDCVTCLDCGTDTVAIVASGETFVLRGSGTFDDCARRAEGKEHWQKAVAIRQKLMVARESVPAAYPKSIELGLWNEDLFGPVVPDTGEDPASWPFSDLIPLSDIPLATSVGLLVDDQKMVRSVVDFASAHDPPVDGGCDYFGLLVQDGATKARLLVRPHDPPHDWRGDE